MHRLTFSLVALLVTALLAAGCGDDEPDASAPSATPAAETESASAEKTPDGAEKSPEAAEKTPEAAEETVTPEKEATKPQSTGNPSTSKPAKSVEECLDRAARYGPELSDETTALCNADPEQGLTSTEPNAGDARLLKRGSRLQRKRKVKAAAAVYARVCVRQIRRRVSKDALDEGIALCRKVQKLQTAQAR